MNSYILETVRNRKEFDVRQAQLPVAEIAIYPWDTAPHHRAYAIAAVGEEALHVFMCSEEEEIRAEQTEQNAPIYTDSCLEFYLMPSPESDLYFNIEVNPKGVIFFSVGKERERRTLISEEGPGELRLGAQIHPVDLGGVGWCVRYELPFGLIHKYVPAFDRAVPLRMRGNFYKCGNGLSQPHWGMWSRVETEKPDFHRPEYFGEIIQG